MQAPEKTQVNQHRPRIRDSGVPQELALGQQKVRVSLSACVCVCVRACVCAGVCVGVAGVSDRSNQGEEGVILFPLGKVSSILVPPKPLSGG